MRSIHLFFPPLLVMNHPNNRIFFRLIWKEIEAFLFDLFVEPRTGTHGSIHIWSYRLEMINDCVACP